MDRISVSSPEDIDIFSGGYRYLPRKKQISSGKEIDIFRVGNPRSRMQL